jgi:RNA polymerase primary sigma factor
VYLKILQPLIDRIHAEHRSYVTHDELNEVLPSDTIDPDKIEDIMAMLSEMGIQVVEAE